MKEIWKDVVGYESWYHVSNKGRVKRIKTGKGTYPGRILKVRLNDNGYNVVALYKNTGKPKCVGVHRLVIQAHFKSNKKEVNHKDGNKLNNYINNLEYTTLKENMKHAHQIGLYNFKFGSTNPNSKLTTLKVVQIRKRYFSGKISQTRLGKEYGVSSHTISSIVNYKTWKSA